MYVLCNKYLELNLNVCLRAPTKTQFPLGRQGNIIKNNDLAEGDSSFCHKEETLLTETVYFILPNKRIITLNIFNCFLKGRLRKTVHSATPILLNVVRTNTS